jgi:AraC family transcriptional regulator
MSRRGRAAASAAAHKSWRHGRGPARAPTHYRWYKITMPERLVRIPLGELPAIDAAGIGVHGDLPSESYGVTDAWWLNLYTYRGRLRVDDRWFTILPRRVALIPPGSDVEYGFSERSVHTAVHFRLLGDAGKAPETPLMQDGGPIFERLEHELHEVITWHARGLSTRAAVRLWDILWELTQNVAPPAARTHGHPAVAKALGEIERRLSEPLSIRELAEDVGISHNHLIRLFRKETGRTIAGYIRVRRAQQAEYLLIHSGLPIKTIAVTVGMSDLQLFNKTVRRELGASPREIRDTREPRT